MGSSGWVPSLGQGCFGVSGLGITLHGVADECFGDYIARFGYKGCLNGEEIGSIESRGLGL